jgi:hypothetical protein
MKYEVIKYMIGFYGGIGIIFAILHFVVSVTESSKPINLRETLRWLIAWPLLFPCPELPSDRKKCCKKCRCGD